MKKEQLTTTLRADYKERLRKLAEENGMSMGQYIEVMLDRISD